MKDYYTILGVPPTASETEIKRAFRRLAVRYHPDKNPSEEAEPLFQEINEAYDVLGDPAKREQYDLRRANPFSEILSQPAAPQHPDPAYRRKWYRKPPKPGPPASYVLMRESLPYLMWISRIGLLFTCLFFADYFFPRVEEVEAIEQISPVSLRRNATQHIIRTASGREIKLYENAADHFFGEESIRINSTPVYGSVIWVSDPAGTHRQWVGHLYSTLIFFPILVFINSLLALIYKKNVEFCFNLNITAGVLLIVTYILL